MRATAYIAISCNTRACSLIEQYELRGALVGGKGYCGYRAMTIVDRNRETVANAKVGGLFEQLLLRFRRRS
jgi:hypothetical protein